MYLQDNGGTARGGRDTPVNSQVLNITVLPVNQPPVFNLSKSTVFVDETDTSNQTTVFPDFAYVVTLGPLDPSVTNEDGQLVTFHLDQIAGQSDLFTSAPAISVVGRVGTLHFALARFQNGNATYDVFLKDNGGTAREGRDLSLTNFSITIAVLPVNQPPVFRLSQTVVPVYETPVGRSDSPVSVPRFASILTFGPLDPMVTDEDNQKVSFTVVGALTDLFSVSPSIQVINMSGTLFFTLAPYQFGNATFSVTLKDNGGTEREGHDTSLPQNFTISVLPVNQPPVFNLTQNQIYVDETTVPNHTLSFVDFATVTTLGPLFGITNENYQQVTFSLYFITGYAALFSEGPSISVSEQFGTLSFVLTPYLNGNASFLVSLQDDGGTARGGIDHSLTNTSIQIVVLPVNQPPVFSSNQSYLSLFQNGGIVMTPSIFYVTSNGPPVWIHDEDSQKVTFIMTFCGGDNSLFLTPPHAVLQNNAATLKFELNTGKRGHAIFNLSLVDNGGTARNGSNTSAVVQFFIAVINFCPDPNSRISGFLWNCNRLVVFENSQAPEIKLLNTNDGPVSDFENAANIFAIESWYLHSEMFDAAENNFSDWYTTNASALAWYFQKYPTISESGSLLFSTRMDKYGEFTFTVRQKNRVFGQSQSMNFSLSVIHIELKLEVNLPALINFSFIQDKLANLLNIDSILVRVSTSDLGSSLEAATLSRRLLVSSYRFARPSSFRRLLQAPIEIRVLCFSTYFCLKLFTSNTKDLILQVIKSNQNSILNISLVSWGLVSNLNFNGSALTSFNTTSSTAYTFEQRNSSTVVQKHFFNSIFVVDTEIDSSGFELLQFQFYPRQYRVGTSIYLSGDGGIIIGLPSAIPSCDPLCHTADMLFTVSASHYGEVDYDVILMSGAGNANRSITIAVIHVNQPPTFVPTTPFVTVWESYDYNTTVIDGFIKNITKGPPPPISNEDYQVLTFFVAKVSGDDLFAQGPSITIQNSTGILNFTSLPYTYGNATFVVQLRDDGGQQNGGSDTSANYTFVIRVRPVNQRPSFVLTTTVLQFNETEQNLAIIVPNIAINISKGHNEAQQLVRFVINFLNISNSIIDVISIQCYPDAGEANMDNDWSSCTSGSAYLEFRPIPYTFGSLVLEIFLTDNAGGTSTSKGSMLTIVVKPVNQPPTFQIANSSILVNENCGSDSVGEWMQPASLPCNEKDLLVRIDGFISKMSLDPVLDPNQIGVFTVEMDFSTGISVVSGLPNVSTTGSISFFIKRNVFGKTKFNMTLTDYGALDETSLSSSPVIFTIYVLRNNLPPSFDILLSQIFLCQGLMQWSGFVVCNISDGEVQETNTNMNTQSTTLNVSTVTPPTRQQTLTFAVSVDNPGLFRDAPVLSLNGVLQFNTSSSFGQANLSITLDEDGWDGGHQVIHSMTKSLLLTVYPVNDMPVFVFPENLVLSQPVVVTKHTIPLFATSISTGQENDFRMLVCSEDELLTSLCRQQTLTFVLDQVSNPFLFYEYPRISMEGTLMLSLTPYGSGESNVTFYAIDDGYEYENVKCPGRNISSRTAFLLTVTPQDYPPAFDFSCKQLDCFNKSNENDACSCTENSTGSVDAALYIRQNSGQVLQDFAGRISTIGSFDPSAFLTFESDLDDGISYVSYQRDALMSSKGFEYVVDAVISNDMRFVYGASMDTDSLPIFEYENSTLSPTLIDTRANNENRLSFNGFDSIQSDFGGKLISSDAVCGWHVFYWENETFAITASGCQSVDAAVNQKLPDTDSVISGLNESTVGWWDFSSQSLLGLQKVNPFRNQISISCDDSGCGVYRQRNRESCRELFDLNFKPASIRDASGILGSAILPGPVCKGGSLADWDTPPLAQSLSLLTFMVNNGQDVEAVQFDGLLNDGLYITDSIHIVNPGQVPVSDLLPTKEISVEVWFAVISDDAQLGGLLAVQQGGPCALGWSLLYEKISFEHTHISSSIIHFSVMLVGNMGMLSRVSFEVAPSIDIGAWHHLVASYDGVLLNLFWDGRKVNHSFACSDPPCGNILYSSPFANTVPSACLDTPFTIGTFDDVSGGAKFPLIGVIRRARIFKKALSAAEIDALFSLLAHTLISPFTSSQNWVQGFQLSSGSSPDRDFSLVDVKNNVTVKGRFNSSDLYRCSFTYSGESLHSELGTVYCEDSKFSCGFGYVDTLKCESPLWKRGYVAAVLGIEHLIKNNSWVAVWQSACLSESCGFLLPEDRPRSAPFPWWADETGKLSPSIVGSFTYFRFLTASTLYRFNQSSESFESPRALESSWNCERLCLFDQMVQQNSISVLGVKSLTSFVIDGYNSGIFIMAANFWNGLVTSVNSTLLLLDPATLRVHLVQEIPTNGAFNWIYAKLEGREIMGVANLFGNTVLYSLTVNVSDVHINVSSATEIPAPGSTSLVSFQTFDNSFIAVSCYAGNLGSSLSRYSALFRVGFPINATHSNFTSTIERHPKDFNNKFISVINVQDFNISGAVEVKHFVIGASRFLFFAINYDQNPSLLYGAPAGKSIPRFQLIQSVAVARVQDVQYFVSRSRISYLLLALAGVSSNMLKWNGSVFLGLEVDNTQMYPLDFGGQIFKIANASSVAYFTSQAEYLVLGSNSYTSDSSIAAGSFLLHGQYEHITDMKGPISLKLMPRSNSHLFLASFYSASISVFKRNNITGLLEYNAEASFKPNASRVSFPPTSICLENGSAPAWIIGFPLRGISALAISNDERNLYASCASDDSVAAFSIDFSGQLLLIQVLHDASSYRTLALCQLQPVGFLWSPALVGNDWTEPVPLKGSSGITISKNGEHLYSVSWSIGAVVALDRSQATNGTLTVVDSVQESERVSYPVKDQPSPDPNELPLFTRSPDLNLLHARHSTVYIIENSTFVAFSGSSDDSQNPSGGLDIFLWNSTLQTLVINQTLKELKGASTSTFFTINEKSSMDIISSRSYFLAVGTSLAQKVFQSNSSSGFNSSATLYVWEPSIHQFVFVQQLDTEGFGVSAIKYFQIQNSSEIQHFLAIACSQNGLTVWGHSKVFKRVYGMFELFQNISTSWASDVEAWDSEKSIYLAFSNFMGKDAESLYGNISIFVFDTVMYKFQLSQVLPAIGAFGIEAFSIPGVGLLLAVANRQSSFAFVNSEYSVYDVASELYIWNYTSSKMRLFQILGPAFKSVMSWDGDVSAAEANVFCFDSEGCSDPDFGILTTVPYLRGATSIHAFESEGEYFIAIAQSVCDLRIAAAQCASFGPPPKSAILQFDYDLNLFGEILTRKHLVRPIESSKSNRKFALRIDASQALHFTYFEVDERSFLIASSVTNGAIIFEWKLKTVVGLQGAYRVDCTDDGSSVFVASRIRPSVIQLRRSNSIDIDSLGQPIKLCNALCLNFVDGLSYENNADVRLLQGVKSIASQKSETSSNAWKVFLSTGVPQDELLCGSVEPRISATAAMTDFTRCYYVHFGMELLSNSKDLFLVPPQIDSAGSLTLNAAANEIGEAVYRVCMLKSTSPATFLETGQCPQNAFFRILNVHILAVNQPPSFSLIHSFFSGIDNCSEMQTKDGLDYTDIVFAVNVTAGENEGYQLLFWNFLHNCSNILYAQPVMIIEEYQNKTKIGVLSYQANATGICRFQVSLSDNGAHNFLHGDRNTSDTAQFYVAVLALAIPPSFKLTKPEVLVRARAGPYLIPDFATDIKPLPYSSTVQNVTFYLYSFKRVGSDLSVPNPFVNFVLNIDGSLIFELANNVTAGLFNVTIEMRQEGQAESCERKTAFQSFLLEILPAVQQPYFTAPNELNLSETQSSVLYSVPFATLAIDMDNVPPQTISFIVVEVSGGKMFSSGPNISATGVLSLILIPKYVGISKFNIVLSQKFENVTLYSSNHVLSISVSHFTSLGFSLQPLIEIVENSGLQRICQFAHNISGNGYLDHIQSFSFHVTVKGPASFQFSSYPSIDQNGNLVFAAANGIFGRVILLVQLFDNTRLLPGVHEEVIQECHLVVYPNPQVYSIDPIVGSVQGSFHITVKGAYFQPLKAQRKGSAQVQIGSSACTIILSDDTMLICLAPAGRGLSALRVLVTEDVFNRSTTIDKVISFSAMVFGGVSSGNSGFLSLGFSGPDTSFFNVTTATEANIVFSHKVKAIAYFQESIYIGGSFQFANRANMNFIALWTGARLQSLGNGLNAPVSSMTVTSINNMSVLLVAGAFTLAYQATSKPSVWCDGIVIWNGMFWSKLAENVDSIEGSVTAVALNGPLIYVSGFLRPENYYALAVFNGSQWNKLGSGIEGGIVTSMTIWNQKLVVCGDFVRAGGLSISKLAVWDDYNWFGFGTMTGNVFSIASLGDTLFVGGDLTMIGNVYVKNIAKYQGGIWSSIGSGLDGNVLSLLVLGRCLYAGGRFTQFASRFCFIDSEQTLGSQSQWAGISNLSGHVYVLASIS